MKQLVQNLKDGKMDLLEVPSPATRDGYVLIQNFYSAISGGTEGKTVKDARAGYIEKARSRKKEVKQVIDSVKTQGFKNTYDMVMNKLNSPSPLGYSCSGRVISVGSLVSGFKEGDFVACGGATANHSEIVAVPVNLCVKVPEQIDMRHSAFTTIGAIAMQGVRQANLNLGEYCAVIGLGLIGQLTIQLLNAAGIFPIGIDIEKNQVELANKIGCGKSFLRDTDNLAQVIYEITHGHGVDSVIITAATSSLDPVEFAGEICRKKGKVVIVGAVPTGFSRENYFKKELELKMSSSYGPGRYDPGYEEKGNDYPIGYVRWTENRNMQAFVDLLSQNKINTEPLITHQFPFEEANKAFDLIIEKTEPYTGILLKYDALEEARNQESGVRKVWLQKDLESDSYVHHHELVGRSKPKIGFIGAGNFAQNFLLPNLISKETSLKNKVEMIGVATSRSTTSRNVADKFGFSYATCDADEIINDEKINTVFIATRHNLHSEYVIKALKTGKNVFTEKPLAMNEEELEKIKTLYYKLPNTNRPLLFVGYNRRFAPHIKKLKEELSEELPVAINYRINAGTIPKEHWVNDSETGGGRIIGEVCHFIDLSMYIAGSSIQSLSAYMMEKPDGLMDTLSINLSFHNGSIASISYFSNGSKNLEKEYLEVFQGTRVFIVDDFKEMKIYDARVKKIKLSKQNKGHSFEVKSFINSISASLPSPIAFEELYITSLATFKVLESINKKQTIIF